MQVNAIKIDDQGYLQFQRTENGHWYNAGCPFLTGQCGLHCHFLEITESPSYYKDEFIPVEPIFIEFKLNCKDHSIQCEMENFINETDQDI